MKHLTLLALCLAAAVASADDAVGWMRVSVPSNDVVGVLLPFSPLGASKIGSLLSGPPRLTSATADGTGGLPH